MEFYSVAWVMPQVWDFGVLVGSTNYISEHGHVAYQIEGDDE